MLENGILEEAKQFYAIYDAKTSAQAIGCKEFLPYFSGEKSLEECVEQLKMQTRRYAKRQLTWFRRNQDTNWLYRDKYENVESFCLAAKKIVEEYF